MHKNYGFLGLALLIMGLSACSSKEKDQAEIYRADGLKTFYSLINLPPEKLRELDLNQNAIQNASYLVGMFYADTKIELTPQKIVEDKAAYCGDREDINFAEPYCKALQKMKCDGKCEMVISRHRCSGVRVHNYFITARHCISDGYANPMVKLTGDHRHIRTYKLEPTKFTDHKEPYDVSIFKIKDGTFSKTYMRGADPQVGNLVFTVGFPYLANRAGAGEMQLRHNGSMRITFGRIVNANPTGKSYCAFTNEDFVTDLERFKLTDGCADTDYSLVPYKWREERDPLLTNTDMTWGMSGAPLFDRYGLLIGIGSNILSNDPKNYNPTKPAVYVKSVNILKLINQL